MDDEKKEVNIMERIWAERKANENEMKKILDELHEEIKRENVKQNVKLLLRYRFQKCSDDYTLSFYDRTVIISFSDVYGMPHEKFRQHLQNELNKEIKTHNENNRTIQYVKI